MAFGTDEKCPVYRGVLNLEVVKYTNVTFETDESVLNSEVSSIQVCIIDRFHSIPCLCLFHSMLVLSMQVWGCGYVWWEFIVVVCCCVLLCWGW